MSHYSMKSDRSFIGVVRSAPNSGRRNTKAEIIYLYPPDKTFPTFREAFIWAQVHAQESMFYHHRFEIDRIGNEFAVGIYSKNTGKWDGWAE